MKKILYILLAVVLCMSCTACASSGNAREVEGTLSEIMVKLYEGIPQDQMPMLMEMEINDENIEYYLGTAEISYEEALASEAAINAVAHSVCLIRIPADADGEAIEQAIRDHVDPRKWICVGVEEENVIVDRLGDLVVLIMTANAPQIHENFLALAK